MASIQSAPNPQRGRRRATPWLIAGLCLLIAGGVYAYIERPWEPRPAIVAVEVVSEGPHVQVLAVNGRVAARHAVKVRAAVIGQAMEVRAEEGASVSVGDVLQHGVVTPAAPGTVDPSTGGRASSKHRLRQPRRSARWPDRQCQYHRVANRRGAASRRARCKSARSEGTQNHVLVLENGMVAQRPIEFSDWPAERVVVTDGLAAGDVVILDPTVVSVGQAVVAG